MIIIEMILFKTVVHSGHVVLMSVSLGLKRKMAKNVSMMNRVRHLLSSSALYSLYCTLIVAYLNYCCVVWGNTYTTSLRHLCMAILQKRAIGIYGKTI